MFNFGRRGCGCNQHHHNPCKPHTPERRCNCKHEHECHKPCEPICFNVVFEKKCCKKFDGCNSYPEVHHDKCECKKEMICCFRN